MARYVILSFEDNNEAELFIAAVERNQAGHHGHVLMAVPHPTLEDQFGVHGLSENVFVRGLYMKPTTFCTCAPSQRVDGYTRGKKFGLWVHAGCGKPARAWAEGNAWYAAIGKNLLPVSPQAPEWRGEGVQGHKWDEEKKQWISVTTGEPWTGKLPKDPSLEP